MHTRMHVHTRTLRIPFLLPVVYLEKQDKAPKNVPRGPLFPG